VTRILLRLLNAPIFVLLVTIGVALQTSLFNSYPFLYLQPDVILLAVIWCALERKFFEGGVLTLIFANIAEIHSAAPRGLFLCSYMAVYLVVRLTIRYFVMPNLSALVMLTLCASILWKFTYISVLSMMGEGSYQWRHLLVLLFPGAVMEGVAAIWCFRWLERFDWVTFKNKRAQAMLDEEMQLEGEGL
jgi:hypothetical protein